MVKACPPSPPRLCLKMTGLPVSLRRTHARIAKNGKSQIKRVVAKTMSKMRFRILGRGRAAGAQNSCLCLEDILRDDGADRTAPADRLLYMRRREFMSYLPNDLPTTCQTTCVPLAWKNVPESAPRDAPTMTFSDTFPPIHNFDGAQLNKSPFVPEN